MSVNNVLKTLMYIYPITKDTIEYNGQIWEPVNEIYLRESLFCKDECLVCGKCCIAEDNLYLPFEVDRMHEVLAEKNIDTTVHKLNGKGYDNIKELIDSLEPVTVKINGKEFTLYKSKTEPNIYEFADRGVLKRCHWDLPTEDGRLGCGIHPVSALTCRMPHVRFFYNHARRSTSIGHSQYGRNWALKCPAKVSKTEFSISTLDTVIANFELLKKYCAYFEINTWCNEILNCLYSVREIGIMEMRSLVDRDITKFSEDKREILF